MRTRPPFRRRNLSRVYPFAGNDYTICVGYFDNGKPAEVFVDGPPNHTGNQLDREGDDACILISLHLQMGMTPVKIHDALSTEPTWQGEQPASLTSMIAHAVVDMEESMPPIAYATRDPENLDPYGAQNHPLK